MAYRTDNAAAPAAPPSYEAAVNNNPSAPPQYAYNPNAYGQQAAPQQIVMTAYPNQQVATTISEGGNTSWACPQCTLSNDYGAAQCAACGYANPNRPGFVFCFVFYLHLHFLNGHEFVHHEHKQIQQQLMEEEEM